MRLAELLALTARLVDLPARASLLEEAIAAHRAEALLAISTLQAEW